MEQSPLQNPLGNITFSTPDLLWLAFYVAALVFTIHAIVIAYHWFTYGTNRNTPLLAVAIYLGVGILILVTLAVTISLTT